jgi:hypothetical protein
MGFAMKELQPCAKSLCLYFYQYEHDIVIISKNCHVFALASSEKTCLQFTDWIDVFPFKTEHCTVKGIREQQKGRSDGHLKSGSRTSRI